ncbi:hypothetical protein PFMALIP_00004 [Plasmodium falciparum MaliPS096_E11]|uniref:Plasmodium falciparum erythrocyte membrane protein 1 acidic terminal segment domain-containing protein n=1 Tax=Plasmodium falciparum MaliPS096_E11 TaxID=1036727 RepID=A0A024WXI0_PLAFA|nr:hypothetical protein PFMALIP_00004 [Plasmodium falciparum MaliPS096_E11]
MKRKKKKKNIHVYTYIFAFIYTYISIHAQTYLKKPNITSERTNVFRVIDITQNAYEIFTTKSPNRYVPYESGRYKCKTYIYMAYIYMEGEETDDYSYDETYNIISTNNLYSYENNDITPHQLGLPNIIPSGIIKQQNNGLRTNISMDIPFDEQNNNLENSNITYEDDEVQNS